MPTSVNTGTRRTFTPGVFVNLDTTALVTPSPQASGIVAILGESVGGAPYTALSSRDDLKIFASAAALGRQYSSGDLFEAANIAFSPSPDHPGAQGVLPLKVNPATRAAITLNGTSGAALKLTSLAWGLSGNTISVAVTAGTQAGTLRLTLAQGQTQEASGDLANDPVAQLTYSSAGGWSAVTLTTTTDALTLSGQSTVASKKADIVQAQAAAASQFSITATPSDLNKVLTVVALDATGKAAVETILLTAQALQTAGTYKTLVGLALSDAALDVKVQDGSGATLGELAKNKTVLGLVAVGSLPVAATTVSVSGASTGKPVVLVGLDAAGNAAAEAVTLAATAKASVGLFTAVQWVGTSLIDGSAVLTAQAAQVSTAGGTTVLAASGALSPVAGLTVKVTPGDETTPLASLDPLAAVPLGAQPVTLRSDLEALVDWVNANSTLVTAEAATGASGVPTTTDAPVYLQGGTERPATTADYLAAILLLKKVRVNLVVATTSDPAVNNAINAHCKLMSGIGESERFCHLGLQDQSQTKPASRTEMYAQRAAINSGYAWTWPVGLIRFDTSGTLRRWQPHFVAVATAGLRAGLPLGQPMTRKTLDAVGIFHDPSWDPVDDSDELIQNGISFLRETDNVGVNVVRDITSWTRDNDRTKSSGSIAFSVGYSVYYYRLGLQDYVGANGSSGTDGAIVVRAITLCDELRTLGAIYGYERPTLTRDGDAVFLDQELHPTEETNFIVANLRLTPTPAAS